MKITKTNYGQEMIPLLLIMVVLFIITSSILFYFAISGYKNSTCIIILSGLALISVIVVATGLWSSRIGKLILRDKVISELNLKGNEKVLDIGCGRGLLTVGIAKQLAKGRIIGLDHWKSTLEYNYTRQMAEHNLAIEGVGDVAEVTDGDAMKLPYEDEKFDLITSSLAMHHIADTSLAFREMWRVLKPGGKIAIADLPVPLFRKQVEETGFTITVIKPLVRLFFIKMRLIIAIKNQS